MSVAVVVGNPRVGSRTLGVAVAVAEALGDLVPSGQSPGGLARGGEPLVVDLATVAAELFDPDSATVTDLLAQVAARPLLIVASPTYKATYTGLLKAFFDRYANDSLAETVAVAVMTGAAPIHALAPEVHLRPLLVELGATVPARGLYVTEPEMADLAPVVEAWAAVARPRIAAALETDRPVG